MLNPLFILSLPRSGSTVLQNILKEHSDIASISEPWLLLPLIYSKKSKGTLTEYSHRNGHLGIDHTIENLTNKEETYFEGIKKMAMHIYSDLAKNDEKFFLDKTPRYHLIWDDIIKVFDNAQFIILVRNPLDIFASMIQTWGNGRLKKLYSVKIDIDQGIRNISNAIKKLGNKAHIVKYEDFIQNKESHTAEIFDFLNLNQEKIDFNNFSKLKGNLGDPKRNAYSDVITSPSEKWKKVFNTKYRKRLVTNWLNQFTDDDLMYFQYPKNDLLAQLEGNSYKSSLSILDRVDTSFYKIASLTNAHLLFSNEYKWAKGKFMS